MRQPIGSLTASLTMMFTSGSTNLKSGALRLGTATTGPKGRSAIADPTIVGDRPVVLEIRDWGPIAKGPEAWSATCARSRRGAIALELTKNSSKTKSRYMMAIEKTSGDGKYCLTRRREAAKGNSSEKHVAHCATRQS